MKRESIERLEFKSLGFTYQDGQEVLKDIDFTFGQRHTLVLQGPMGSGKSTVMKLLLGLVAPTHGEYLINGKVVNDFDHNEFNRFRLNMGYSFDMGGLINNKTLYENLALPLEFHGFLDEKSRKAYINEYLNSFNLQDQRDARPAFVTSGARKAVSVLKAFILNPEVLILNDPTLGLNSEHVSSLVDLIKQHQMTKGPRFLIMASEDTHFIKRLNGRVVQIVGKNIIADTNLHMKVS